MAEFCDTCNKPIASNRNLQALAVYCKCDMPVDKLGKISHAERMDGNKVTLCACGCGQMTKNGWKYLKAHRPKEEQRLTRTETTVKIERAEAKVIEESYKQSQEIISDIEKEDKNQEEGWDGAIDYEAVENDLMMRYTEIGIALTAVRRILRSQGKKVDD